MDKSIGIHKWNISRDVRACASHAGTPALGKREAEKAEPDRLTATPNRAGAWPQT